MVFPAEISAATVPLALPVVMPLYLLWSTGLVSLPAVNLVSVAGPVIELPTDRADSFSASVDADAAGATRNAQKSDTRGTGRDELLVLLRNTRSTALPSQGRFDSPGPIRFCP
jgi:hypothetical protein